jgi:membrane-associated phospholipid phosphatase
MDFPLATGIDVISMLQRAGWLDSPMRFFSFLGSEQFFMFVLPVIYWCLDAGLGMRVGFILLFSDAFNGLLKLALHSPRPYWVDAKIRALASETSFGAPSGHAQNAAAIWGMIGARSRSNAIWWLSGTLIFLIGLSRMYLAVHFPTDVILGWLFGALILSVFLALWDPIVAWLKQRTLVQQLLLSLVLPAAALLFTGAAELALRGFVLPAEWSVNAARAGEQLPAPISMAGAVTDAGTLFGLALGLVWVQRMGGFQPSGPLWKRLGCLAVGVIGVGVLYLGLKLIFPAGETLVAAVFRFVRYALIGLWVSGGAPWAFARLGLLDEHARAVSTQPSAVG